MALAKSSGALSVEFWTYWGLAVLEGLLGNTEEMADHVNEANRVAQELRSPVLSLRSAELAIEQASATGDWESGIIIGEQSIAKARARGARKVIHLVGQFHCDFEGGTVQQLRRFRPADRILVISMQRAEPVKLLDEDLGRADIVIYTGERPPEEEETTEEAPDQEMANEDTAASN